MELLGQCVWFLKRGVCQLELPTSGRRERQAPFLEREKRKSVGTYGALGLSSVSGKKMRLLLPGTMLRPMESKELIGPREHGIPKCKMAIPGGFGTVLRLGLHSSGG